MPASTLPPSSPPPASPSPNETCIVCRLPTTYDHVAWARGESDGYSCQCGRDTPASVPSPPDNTPTRALTPQLGRRTVPFVDEVDSEINYEEKENDPSIPPAGFIPNLIDHPFFYPIYVDNPDYVRTNDSWTNERKILAPFICYSSDYTTVQGSAGVGRITRTLQVQMARVVPRFAKLTPQQWRDLEAGSEKEFAVNLALAEINDP